nr:hypothetical protein [Tanacetum cinerariifolium]
MLIGIMLTWDNVNFTQMRDLHTTNVDQLHAYLGQREFHANEVRLMHEHNSDSLALVATHQMTHGNAPSINQQPDFSQPNFGLIVLVFQKGDDPIDPINHMMSFLTDVVTSRYPPTNNQLRNSSNPRQQATINNGRVTIQPIQGRHTSLAAGTSRTYTSGASGNNSWKQRTVICYNYKGEGHMSKQCTKLKRKMDESWFKDKVLLVQAQANGQILHEKELAFLADTGIAEAQTTQTKAQQLEPKLYDGNVIQKTNAILIRDSEKNLMLAEEIRSKMLLKQKDLMMSEKKVNTKQVDYANSEEPTPSTRPTQVELPKELPKVSMVNTSLKKLKHHLASFDDVVKEITTATAITEGTWRFEHTKACFRDEISPFVKTLKNLFNSFDQFLIDELSKVQNVFHQMKQAIEQHRVESKTFQVKMNKVLNENERLLEQVISKDVVNIIVTSTVNNAYEPVHECERCVKLETELQRISLKGNFMINCSNVTPLLKNIVYL